MILCGSLLPLSRGLGAILGDWPMPSPCPPIPLETAPTRTLTFPVIPKWLLFPPDPTQFFWAPPPIAHLPLMATTRSPFTLLCFLPAQPVRLRCLAQPADRLAALRAAREIYILPIAAPT